MTQTQEQLLKLYQILPIRSKCYFHGHFPIVCGVEGYDDPEPTAMKYLVESGLVVTGFCGFTGRRHYLLSDSGRALQEMLWEKHI